MSPISRLEFCAVLVVAASSCALANEQGERGGIVIADGTLEDTDQYFNRPVFGGAALSGSQCPYDVVPFTANTAEIQTLRLQSGYDNFMVIYANSFDPMQPLVNLIEADDDSGPGLNAEVVRSFTPGVQYFAVLTSFSPNSRGDWSLQHLSDVEGGIVAGLVPAPGGIVLWGGLLAVVARRRRA